MAKYTEAKLQIVAFEAEDVITTSSTDDVTVIIDDEE
jgi:hypothetical protein